MCKYTQQTNKQVFISSTNTKIHTKLFGLQADPDHAIRFKVDHFRLPCGSQWLKVRDGNSLSATLLSQLAGTLDTAPSAVQSTGPYLLLEFFSDELMAGGEACGGGFLAHAQQISEYMQFCSKMYSKNI